MKSWGRWHTLAAGLSLVLATNAAVLGGVIYNRGGEPDAVLQLTERELQVSQGWVAQSEDSGLALRMSWRVGNDTIGRHGPRIEWLNEGKLLELGFDVSRPPGRRNATWRYDWQVPREVLLVLEYDGQAYRKALAYAEELVAQATDKGRHFAQMRLNREQNELSRLFVIDAGLDQATLRMKYPDRSRYAIARGKISVLSSPGAAGEITGYISDLSVDSLNVPVELRDVFGRGKRYVVTVIFGRRLEPWLAAASRAN